MSEREALILGALLHDIGKFCQRTKAKLTQQDERLIGICCPHFKERYTHQHVLYSGRFVRNFLGKGWEIVENLGLYHHLPGNCPQKLLANIVTLADWLASGERRGREEEEPGDPRKEPLISIFSQISLDGKEVPEHYCSLLPLQVDLTGLFPKLKQIEAISKDGTSNNSYSKLWEDFLEEVKMINFQGLPFNVIFSQLFYLLEKYTIFIPSAAYIDKPDLSLFHHLKSSAALADCIYQLNLSEDKIDKILDGMKSRNVDVNALDEDSCLLVGGDISGIQDFIYAVTSEHALKGLKGRSIYLQLLSETIAKTILVSFDLSLCNLLYSGGGHFYVLLPAIEEAEEKLSKIRSRLEHTLLKAHQGRLSIVIATQKLKWKDFQGKNFGINWIKLGEKLAREKKAKFVTLLKSPENVAEILGPYEEGGNRKACEICGEELSDGEEGQCHLCQSFSKLASNLSVAQVIEEENIPLKDLQHRARKWHEVLEALGGKFNFLEEKEVRNPLNTFLLNSVDFLLKDVEYLGFKLIARHIAKKDGQIKTLDDLAKEAKGIKKWGALRADVDHLGKIFAEGLGKDRTISRVSMLSYMLSLFFTAQVESTAREPEFNGKVYIVYSGGDDLSIIGAWSVLSDFAQRVNSDFRKFTCQNLTLSAGIYLAPSVKFPVYQAANAAGETLARAKVEGRDNLIFLDHSLAWEDLAHLKVIMQKIVSLLEGGVAKTLLSILYSSFADRILAKEGRISMFRIWRLLYALKRLKERHKGRVADLTDLERTAITDHNLRPNLNVAIQWAEYLSREEVT